MRYYSVVFLVTGVLAGFPLLARAPRGAPGGSESDSQTQGPRTPRFCQIDRDVYAATDLYHSAGRGLASTPRSSLPAPRSSSSTRA